MQFQTRIQQPSTTAELANVSSAGMVFVTLFPSYRIILYTGILLTVCRRNTGEPTHASDSPMAQPSSPQAEISSSPRIQSPLPQVEIPVSLEMTPPSLQPETSNLPGTALASPQAEVSALPGTPQTPLQLVTQEIPLEPGQTPASTQEIRHEVSASTQLLLSFSNKSSLIQQSFFLRIKLHHHQALHLW
jgi:hypothetical protein